MEWLQLVHGSSNTAQRLQFSTGDDVRVWYKIAEQGKERLGQFEGIVIRIRGSGPSKTFTVRRVTQGVGVERAFPVDAPVIDRVEVLRRGKTRRSRLYYLRRVVRKTRLESAEGPEGAAPSAGGPEGSAESPTASRGSREADAGRDDIEAATAAADKPTTGRQP